MAEHSALTLLGPISAEGGPLLVLDAGLLRYWRGIEGTGADYERACAFFDADPAREGGPIALGPGHGLLWEMGGAGTAWVFSAQGRCVVARTWLNADDRDASGAAARLAGLPLAGPSELGLLDTPSRDAVLLWATEDASTITALHSRGGRPEGDFAMSESALALRMTATRHRCLHDAVGNDDGSARRLHVRGL